MTVVALPPASLLEDAGALLWAPGGSALPANTVVGSVFTDSWPAAWIAMGRTDTGSKIEDTATSSDIESAEDYVPLDTRTTKRAPMVSFSLMSFTATNLSRALNGAITTVTGSGTTLLTQVDAPSPANEVPCMIGYESLDGTVRWVGRQVRNSGNLSVAMTKAPAKAMIPWTGVCSKPASAPAYSWWTAGTARA